MFNCVRHYIEYDFLIHSNGEINHIFILKERNEWVIDANWIKHLDENPNAESIIVNFLSMFLGRLMNLYSFLWLEKFLDWIHWSSDFTGASTNNRNTRRRTAMYTVNFCTALRTRTVRAPRVGVLYSRDRGCSLRETTIAHAQEPRRATANRWTQSEFRPGAVRALQSTKRAKYLAPITRIIYHGNLEGGRPSRRKQIFKK